MQESLAVDVTATVTWVCVRLHHFSFSPSAAMALASLLDSEATFTQQAEECGLSEPWVTALKNNAVATFAKLGFSITSPGTVATDDQVNRFLNDLRPGVVPTIADLAAFKRVLF